MRDLRKVQELTERVPLWVCNLLTIISSVIAILSLPVNIVAWLLTESNDTKSVPFVAAIIGLAAAVLILLTKLFKYRKLLRMRLQMTSKGMHDLTHNFRNTFFDILHQYKIKNLTIPLLSTEVIDCMKTGLDSLCNVMKAYTGEEVSACIKLIEGFDNAETIDLENTKVKVLCRSRNSDSRRITYDNSPGRKTMYLKDDTVLMRIVSPGGENQFYCGDLDKFEKACKDAHEEYYCSTKNRPDFYNGTMVLPIQILYSKLYYFKKNDAYHIIGF